MTATITWVWTHIVTHAEGDQVWTACGKRGINHDWPPSMGPCEYCERGETRP